jgi:hypothetical protein
MPVFKLIFDIINKFYHGVEIEMRRLINGSLFHGEYR